MTRPRTDSPATAFAVALLDEFVRLGVRDVVLSPGSRSQALALAAAEFERIGELRLRVRIDERVAAFLALGIAVETRAPVLVITTSGTAVANLHPAVLEAHHAGVPLILLTADRPASMRGIGGNQTTNQPGIFGTAVSNSWDIGAPVGEPGETDAAAQLARDAFAAATGPVHINLAFTEPLSSAVSLSAREAPVVVEPSWLPDESPAVADSAFVVQPQPGTVVVAGSGAGPRAEEVARQLGVPLLAELASGARFGPNLVVAYRELLNTANFGDRITRVFVFGHPTLSREVPGIIQRRGVETVVVRSAAADQYNPGHRVGAFVDAVRIEGEPDDSPSARAWLGRWVTASRALVESADQAPDVAADPADFARAELAAVRAPVTRRSLVEAAWRATWPHDRLVLGASRLIREADKVVPGKKISVHANRGLAGIDGTVSTAVGIALASQAGNDAGGTTRVVLGDLALLHDVGALLFGAGEARPRIQVIVGNDNGGTIFDGLEVGATAPTEAFDRVLLTAQQFSIEHLAAAYGWEYRRVENRGQLDQALTASAEPVLIEVPLPR